MSTHNLALADPTAFAPTLAEPGREAQPEPAVELRRGARSHLLSGAAIVVLGMLTLVGLPVAGNVLDIFGVMGIALTTLVGGGLVLWGSSQIAESHVLRRIERARHLDLHPDDRALSPSEHYAHLAGAPVWATPVESAWFAAGDAPEI